jgi:tRNA A-37 threonylcarbamoyl transferase component Bud32
MNIKESLDIISGTRVFIKEDFFIKQNVAFHEFHMLSLVQELNIVNSPKIIDYNKETKVLCLENIPKMSISDEYGDKFKNIPIQLKKEIRDTIKKMYENNIIYIDITGYNFIYYQNKIWIIDFEHSYIKNDCCDENKLEYDISFIKKFIKGSKNWNDDFL